MMSRFEYDNIYELKHEFSNDVEHIKSYKANEYTHSHLMALM